MDFLLLGPLEVWHEGSRMTLGPRRGERCLLGLLLLQAGRVVPVDRLLSQLWDDEPPANGTAVIQTHLARLRSVLDPERDGRFGLRLVRSGEGYLADTDPDTVDAHRFRTGVERAAAIAAPASRAVELRRTMALWRGPLLADVATDRLRDRIGAGLDELRLAAVESCVEAELECGQHDRLIPELTELAAAHPLRERLIRALMLALYRGGRRADALTVYRQTRTHLADELGLDPGAELERLHDAILRADPALDLTPTGAVGATGPHGGRTTRPAQLPARAPHFTGRTAHLARLDSLLTEPAADTDPGGRASAVVISAIAGTAGVGKTALAVQWAHRCRDRFPDGQLYVNLRGFDPGAPPMDPAEAVRGFLTALGVTAERMPADLAAQIGLYRSLLDGKRVLVVLDNARDADQVRPLIPGAPDCFAIVTSRNQLTSLVATDGAHSFGLDLLTVDEARELLIRRLGRDRTEAEPAAVDEIIARCARLPLALAIAAAHAATHPGLSLAEFAGELRDGPGSLDALDAGDATTRVRAVFALSYRQLSAPAARLFRLLALHPGPDWSVAAAASLAGLPPGQAYPLLAELTRAHLIGAAADGRYTCHDLLRAYARELADADPEAPAAVYRLLDHYLHTAHPAAQILHDSREPIPLDPVRAGVTPELLDGTDQVLAWFDAEHSGLLGALRLAAATGADRHAWQLAWSLDDYLERRGHWQDWERTQHAALAAAERLGDRELRARAHLNLGFMESRRGRLGLAEPQLRQALELFGELGSRLGEAFAHAGMARVADGHGHHQEALRQSELSYQAYRDVGRPDGAASALGAIGWHYIQLGDPRRALTHCRQALTLHEEAGNRYEQANTLDSLGYAHHHLGEYPAAADCYQQAIVRYREVGDRWGEATTLDRLGDTHLASGQPGAAREAWQSAEEILAGFHDTGADPEQVRAKLRKLEDC